MAEWKESPYNGENQEIMNALFATTQAGFVAVSVIYVVLLLLIIRKAE